MKLLHSFGRLAAVGSLAAAAVIVIPAAPAHAANIDVTTGVAMTCAGRDAQTQFVLDTFGAIAVPPVPPPVTLPVSLNVIANQPDSEVPVGGTANLSFSVSPVLGADLTDLAAKAGIKSITLSNMQTTTSMTGPATASPAFGVVSVPGPFVIDLTQNPIQPPVIPPITTVLTSDGTVGQASAFMNSLKFDVSLTIPGVGSQDLKLDCLPLSGTPINIANVGFGVQVTTTTTAAAAAATANTAAAVAGNTAYAG